MRMRPSWFLALSLFLALGWLAVLTLRISAQNPAAQAPPTAPGVIKAQANLVLVDAIVTDKKGNYIRDLEQKDFHVFEDSNEQPITSFSRGSGTAAPAGPASRHYIVLFFDNSTMDLSDQARARQAAGQFIEKTASADRLMAVVDYGGTLQIARNFTANADSLKRAVANVRMSAVESSPPPETAEVAALGMVSLEGTAWDFGARTMLLALGEMCKKLQTVPGRKTLILFSAGFPLTVDRQAELAATINSANRANVAIYPMDVRGLTTLTPSTPGTLQPGLPGTQPGLPGQPISPLGPGADSDNSPFPHEKELLAALLALPSPLPQRPGGGGGGGVGGGGGGGGVGGGGGRPGGGGVGGGGTGGGRGGGTTGGGSSGGKGGTGSGGSGGRGGGGTTGRGGGTTGRGGGGGFTGANRYVNPLYQPRSIIPPMLPSASTNQQVLAALASGTGGFPIFNSNDFLGGLQRIGHELDEYYVLGYVPPLASLEGGCHTLSVKVDRDGVNIRSRSGYCDVKKSDLLAGKPEGKSLEALAAGAAPGTIPVTLQVACFFKAPGVTRVNLAIDIPGDNLEFEKDKGKFHSQVNVLGMAYREDGSVGARFTDQVKLDLDKKEQKEIVKGAFSYENSFDIAPGNYKLKLVLSAGGEKFAKYELPLRVEAFDGKQFQLSGPALSDQVTAVSQLSTDMDAALMEDRPLLVAGGYQVTPSASNRFRKDAPMVLYAEVYEPLEQSQPDLRVGVLYSIVNPKTKQEVFSSNTIPVDTSMQGGSPLIPVIVKVPLEQLQAGDYQLQVRARDSMGHASPMRSADFAVE